MDRPETVLDVSFYHPLIRARGVDEEPHLLDGVLGSAPGPESVGGRAEVRLEDRLEHELGRHLHDPVAHRRDAQASELPGRASGSPLARRQRTIGAILELLRSLARTPVHAHLLDMRCGSDHQHRRSRDPRLRFTRSHATSSVAGSQTRLNRSPKRCCSSWAAHRCSLVCHPSTRSSRQVDVERRGRIHARPPERRLMPRSCCPPSPCGRLSRPRTTTRTPTRPAPISRHRALPGRHQQPGARGASPTFTMIRLTGSAAGSTPTAHPAGTRSLPPATTPGSTSQDAERAAIDKGGIVAAGDPCPPGFGSLDAIKGLRPPIRFRSSFRSR